MTTSTDQPRRFEMSLAIDAPQQDVWDALTKAEELVRWFPLQAEVTPGAGGSMKWAWGDAWSGIMRIDAWNPPSMLRLVDENARPYDAEGKPVSEMDAAPARVAVEVTLETNAGQTVLRLVHSGFGTGAAWDEEIEGVSSGWPYELRSLAHYLTRHRGRDRSVAAGRGSTTLSMADAWSRLMGPGGVNVNARTLAPGEPYTATLATGERFSGEILMSIPGREFSGISTELDDGLFRICAYAAGGKAGFTVWAVTYRPDSAARMDALGGRLQGMLDGLFSPART